MADPETTSERPVHDAPSIYRPGNLRARHGRAFFDSVIGFIYSRLREDAHFLFRHLVSGRASSLMAFLNYELFLSRRITGVARFVRTCGIDSRECADPLEMLDTPKKIFERRIRYWEYRPMPKEKDVILSPADARMLPGSLGERIRPFPQRQVLRSR